MAFASALAARPAVLALDEPTAGQDFYFRQALARLLDDIRGEGMLVILVTHDLAFAETCADRWLLMNAGRILADAAPQRVMADQAAMDRAGLAPTDRFILRTVQSQGKGHV